MALLQFLRQAYEASNKKYEADRKKAIEEEKKAAKAAKSEADELAKQLGINPGASALAGKIDHEKEADQLAKQLGVSASKDAPRDYTAAQLKDEIDRWEAQERLRLAEEERERQRTEEYERVAAIDRAKREAILREQQMTLRQQQQTLNDNGADESTADSDDKPGLFGSLLGAAAKGYIAKEMGMDPVAAAMADSWTPSRSAPTASGVTAPNHGGESCRTDPEMMSHVNSIIENCTTAYNDSCEARMQLKCWRQISAVTGSCAAAHEESLAMVKRFEQEAAACQ